MDKLILKSVEKDFLKSDEEDFLKRDENDFQKYISGLLSPNFDSIRSLAEEDFLLFREFLIDDIKNQTTIR